MKVRRQNLSEEYSTTVGWLGDFASSLRKRAKQNKDGLTWSERQAKKMLDKWPADRIAVIVNDIPAEKLEEILTGMTPERKSQIVGLLFQNEEFRTLAINIAVQDPNVINLIPPETLTSMLMKIDDQVKSDVIRLLLQTPEFQSLVISLAMQNADIVGQLPPERLAEIAKALPSDRKEQVIKILFDDPEFQALAIKVVKENPSLLSGTGLGPQAAVGNIGTSILNSLGLGE